MPLRQIKPKMFQAPSGYSDSFATEGDKSNAKQRADGDGVIRVVWVVVSAATLFILWHFFWQSFVDPDLSLATPLVFMGICAVVAWVITRLIRGFYLRTILAGTVTQRLNVEYTARVAAESAAVSAAVVRASTILEEQKESATTLRTLLTRTDASLDSAEQLFSERAYTPFWDSVEDAVETLRQFERCVGAINQAAKEYRAQLDGREHTFPPFPTNSGDLPNPDGVIKRLETVVAEAQRDFQFASIFEQRRTTSAIVVGFRNTQEAIFRLRNDIVNSFSDLQQSLELGLDNISSNIEEGFESLAQSHRESINELQKSVESNSERDAKHQEFVEGSLDNIQNRRKPRSSETKEPFRKA